MTILDQLELHRKTLMTFAMKLTRNKEQAQDLLQTIALKFLQTPPTEEILNSRAYLCGAIKMAFLNLRTVNKKYAYVDTEFPDNQYESDLIDSIALSQIRKKAKTLPPKQAQQMAQALSGNDIGEGLGEDPSKNPKYETNKTHRRLGTQALKRMME